MKLASGVLVLLALCSLPLQATQILLNDSGELAFGIRVVFSQPVTLNGFGDTLGAVTPSTENAEFIFFAGTVVPWGTHWLSWEPREVALEAIEWLPSPMVELPDDIDVPYTIAGSTASVPCRFGVAPSPAGIEIVWKRLKGQESMTAHDSLYVSHGFGFGACVDLSALSGSEMISYVFATYSFQLSIDGSLVWPAAVHIWQEGAEGLWRVRWVYEFGPGEIPPGEHEKCAEYTCVLRDGTAATGEECLNCDVSMFDSCTPSNVCTVYAVTTFTIDP